MKMKLWLCRRGYEGAVRSGLAYESFTRPFEKLCDSRTAPECRRVGKCLCIPFTVDIEIEKGGA